VIVFFNRLIRFCLNQIHFVIARVFVEEVVVVGFEMMVLLALSIV
jgi:hypothetical protein